MLTMHPLSAVFSEVLPIWLAAGSGRYLGLSHYSDLMACARWCLFPVDFLVACQLAIRS